MNEFNALLEQATVNQDPALRDALIASAGPDGVEYDEEVGPNFNAEKLFVIRRKFVFRMTSLLVPFYHVLVG